ncbi:DUF3939 domain-containing protein [Salisediminibacterium halotolerans]|uniref:DUF3939 domain-containing protein n=1 Tax=Salisediminibacterium halotolerans TaxID=517425 RepID=UPI000EB53053|nr:DUF3939 domain-containing protein [Salisediminibacterium halotolerans]RLJ69230.1 uncharacterized protein DUF3939 [Actinophytocola xinjiangensis]RPE87035.1 uncharacterized protein DUF3939 [Salisediminibacterium halotolerans]TWG32232.1 uncharacterized protein DUF3939 [Salisediminibacterium halotolerans]GEL08775.1 hypothetical protein SHA02_21910 [Salisediminibacterium halotolerans]
MFFRKRKKQVEESSEKGKNIEIISVSIEEMRKAVNAFAANLDDHIPLRSIIKSDHQIDTELLYSYLGGQPDKTFYMSKETYEIFEEPDLPMYIDQVQIACDQYVLETGKEPLVAGNKDRKINYFKLKHYLHETPPFDLYLHPLDRMVTHRKPGDS